MIRQSDAVAVRRRRNRPDGGTTRYFPDKGTAGTHNR
ncbi:hypothetical protein STENM223S_00835 [Streptomyces tendae]